MSGFDLRKTAGRAARGALGWTASGVGSAVLLCLGLLAGCGSSDAAQPGPVTFPSQGVWGVIGGSLTDANDPNAIDRIDPATGKMVGRILAHRPLDSTGLSPGVLSAMSCGGKIWAGGVGLDIIDPTTQSVQHLTHEANALILSQGCQQGFLWAVDSSTSGDSAIERYDSSGQLQQRIVLAEPMNLVVGSTAVWVIDSYRQVHRIDLATGQDQVIDLSYEGLRYQYDAVAADGQDVWVLTSYAPPGGGQILLKLDESTGALVSTIQLPPAGGQLLTLHAPGRIVVGFGSLWTCTVQTSGFAVTRIHPDTGAIDVVTGLGECSDGEIGFGQVWATDYKNNSVVRIDPATNAVTGTTPTGTNPRSIAFSE